MKNILEIINSLAIVVTAITAVVMTTNVYYTKENLKLAEETVKVSKDNLKFAEETLKITKEGFKVTEENLNISKLQLHDDYERSKRENSLNIALDNAQDKSGIGEGLICVQFLADMSGDEISKIFSFDELNIDTTHLEKLNRCLAGQNIGYLLKSSKKHSTLTKPGSYYVFHKAMRYLDFTEILASAYYSGIVDRDIIKHYFEIVFRPRPVAIFIDKLSPVGQKTYKQLRKYLEETKEDAPPFDKKPLGN